MSRFVQSHDHNDVKQIDEPFLLHHFFERAASRWPEQIALEIPPDTGRTERRAFSYAQIDVRANSLADRLREFASEDRVVAILLPRSTENLYLSQLAVLKSGSAYTCIDPASPDQHIAELINDSQAVVCLTDGIGLRRVERSGFPPDRILNLEEFPDDPDKLKRAKTPEWLTANSLAYVIYTSGTTGRSKGVMIEHGSISNLVASDLEEFALAPGDRVAQNSSAAYDSSVEEIWLAFASGATLVVCDEDTVRLGPDLPAWLRRERITVFCPPPTLLRATGCKDPQTDLPELSFVYLGGEALTEDIAERWVGGRLLVNGYGPTECSVTCTREPVRPGEDISIGLPVRGFQAWVLDAALDEVADGERGELCIGGIGLARGYLNRPELTAEKFPEHPRLGRIYRTGDLVHRAGDGRFFFHGRIDSQVKLRGYRIELEAIESRLAECQGVREAACTVQGEGAQQTLVAFVVPRDADEDLLFDELKSALRSLLPAHMVPSRFAIVSKLPLTIGGKLNRKALPSIDLQSDGNKQVVEPRDEMEARIEAAFREVLRSRNGISVDDDFFTDLGGDSLNAAELISVLRDDPATESIAVRDLYEARTVAEIAQRVQRGEAPVASIDVIPTPKRVRPGVATALQAGWLLMGLMLGSVVAYLAAVDVVPFFIRSLGLVPFLLFGPLLMFAALAVYTPAAVLLVAAIKKLLIGQYRSLREPVWGSFYIRNWMVQKAVRIVPWAILQGTAFHAAALRALGARIGKRVHIHRGVNLLQGGWDLLEIGDDVTISQDASIRIVDFDDGHIVIAGVYLGDRSTLDVRAGVAGNTRLEAEAYLTALSSLPEGACIPKGERWDGIPARPNGLAPPRPRLTDRERLLSPVAHGVAMIVARATLTLILAAAFELPLVGLALIYGLDAQAALEWFYEPWLGVSFALALIACVTLPGPFILALEALIVRALGRFEPSVINRWSPAYIRVWLKTQVLQSAGLRLSGTLFWPMWLRLAGMKVGKGCEISTITDVIPELIEIGEESFFADGIYLGGPRVHRGTVALDRTRLEANTFLGNHSVIAAGQRLPKNTLLGVCTVADDAVVREGTAWFGLPPFELPRREETNFDRSLTHEPTLLRYINRLFWELFRFGLPAVPVLVLPIWFKLLFAANSSSSPAVVAFVDSPLISLGAIAFFCFFVLALKWLLLGRVKPGVHVLWSCWCSRWDFVYVAWAVFAANALSLLEGTLILSWYLRLMGAKIGRGVVLSGGFSQVVDPDMLTFEDGSTVSCQFQAHTFEDRVLKIDRVTICRGATVGSGAVLLYGADIGARTHVAPQSVVMKRESLLPDHSYIGAPTRPVNFETAPAANLSGELNVAQVF